MTIAVERFQNWVNTERGAGSYKGRNEAIQFKTSRDLRMTGLRVYYDVALGNAKSNNAKLKILRLINDDEKSTEEIGTIDAFDFNWTSKEICFKEFILIRANIWHVITGTISGSYYYGVGGRNQVEEKGVVFEFRNSKLSEGTDVTKGQFPWLHFEHLSEEHEKLARVEDEKEPEKAIQRSAYSEVFKSKIAEMEQLRKENIDFKEKIAQKEQEYNNTINEQSDQILNHQAGIDKLCNALTESSEKATGAEMRCRELIAENQQMRQENCDLKEEVIRVKLNALQGARGILKFNEKEKIPKLLICIQLQNGTLLYFDNNKPFELFTNINDNRVIADLKLLEGEYDCSFKGTIGNCAYFSSARGKTIRFIKASMVNDQIVLDETNQLDNSDLDLFTNEPIYFIDELREWVVYQHHENFSQIEGEKFDTSEIRLIRKYTHHYHKGIIYFFRANSTAKLERINEKIVIVEGPILEGRTLSFYNPPHSDFIYIANSDQNALLILNTTNLNVSQQCYEPPIESTYHSIAGVHEGILTMLFEGKSVGRCLMTTKIS